MGFPGGASGKEPKAGDIRDMGSIPGSRRSPGGWHGNPLQNSSLENPMDRGAWWATVHRVAQSRTQLKWLSMHSCVYHVHIYLYIYIHFHFQKSRKCVSTIKLKRYIWLPYKKAMSWQLLIKSCAGIFSQSLWILEVMLIIFPKT